MSFQSPNGASPLDLPFGSLKLSDAACHAHDQNNFIQVAFCLVEALRPHLFHDEIGTRKLVELEQALESLERMNRDVLDMGHVHRDTFLEETLEPDAVIERTAALAKSMDTKGIRIELRLGAAGAALPIFEIHLQQVVFNLLKNALEAAPAEGGRVVAVSAIQPHRKRDSTRTGRGTLRITITDNGPGIPEEIHPHLFRCGFTSKPDGHGFGLYHIRRILGMHGGSINLHSHPARGTRATVLWPF